MAKPRNFARKPHTAVKRGRKLSAADRDDVRRKKSFHHIKLLHRALKKAKQFELGKIKRRLKAASDDAERSKVATQLAAINQLDLDATARQAADKCGLVHQADGAHAAAASPGAVKPNAGAAATDVQSALQLLAARLLASKAVRDEVAAAQQALAALDQAAARAAAAEQQRHSDAAARQALQAAAATKPAVEAASRGDDGRGDSSASQDSMSESENSDAVARRRAMLLGGISPADIDAAAKEGAELDEAAAAADPALPSSDQQPLQRSEKQHNKAPKQPKNRLGQRARRRLAEQQHGRGARHLAEQAAPQSTAGSSGSGRPAATSDAQRPLGSQAAEFACISGSAGRDGASSASAAATEDSLHPSWAAKARAKQQLAAKPAGKKIVFDDDGGTAAILNGGSAADTPASAIGRSSDGARSAAAPGSTSRPSLANRAAGSHSVDSETKMQGQAGAPRRQAERQPGVLRHSEKGAAPKPHVKLHPSWEAKAKLRQQMEHIPKPEGRKVVFDDSD